jgi:hypothetical protein
VGRIPLFVAVVTKALVTAFLHLAGDNFWIGTTEGDRCEDSREEGAEEAPPKELHGSGLL